MCTITHLYYEVTPHYFNFQLQFSNMEPTSTTHSATTEIYTQSTEYFCYSKN